MFKKDYSKLLEKALQELELLNYAEQFLDLFADFFTQNLPVKSIRLYFLNNEETQFKPYPGQQPTLPKNENKIGPITPNDNLIVYLKNTRGPIILKEEKESRISFLKKTNNDFFDTLPVDIIIPLFSLKKLQGFAVLQANSKTYRELDPIADFLKIFSNILLPLVTAERIQMENSRNYYKIYRMDRLAMVGELAASAAHEIKNPLAGVSTFLKYFTELKDFNKQDIIEELHVMKDSIRRIDEITKSLLSFSRFKKKKISKISFTSIIESSIHSIALKIPPTIEVEKKMEEDFIVESDPHQFQQVLVNILFNAVEAIDKKKGKIAISTYVSGRDQLPSRELFNISIKDNGPGIDDAFKEQLFQPFRTTKEEGTGLGLYTCYGLMKSLGGSIKINSSKLGTEVILSLPYSFDDEEED